MTHKLLIFFLLFGSVCAGQTDYNTAPDQTVNCPVGPGPVSQEQAAQCPPGANGSSANGPGAYSTRTGTNLTPGSTQVPNEAYPRPGSTLVPSTRVIGPITARSEFEMFAEDAAGRTLRVY